MKRVQSYSSISTYMNCGKAYEFSYELKEPRKTSEALIEGSAMHAMMQAHNVALLSGKGVHPDKLMKAYIKRLMLGIKEAEQQKVVFEDGLNVDDLRARASLFLHKYMKELAPKFVPKNKSSIEKRLIKRSR